jgi:putative DNA primase/helicase
MSAAEKLVERLEGVHGSGPKWSARCPAHDDRNPSLAITEKANGDALVHCHAGCSVDEVVVAVGLEVRDLFAEGTNGDDYEEAVYSYADADGKPSFEVVRFAGKKFRQRLPDGTWGLNGVRPVLYRLPQVLAAAKAGRPIWVVEGEKDVHALEHVGQVATCNPGGAAKWRDEYSEVLHGARVGIVADRDAAGRAHAQQVAEALPGIAAEVTVLEPAEGKDAADHLRAGKGLEDFVRVADTAAASSLVDFTQIVARPVRWAWRDRVALAKITALAGRPKIGKGLLYTHLIAQVTRGTLAGDLHGPRDAIIVTTEDDPGDTLKPRLMAAGADLPRVSSFQMGSRDEPVAFRVPQDAAELGRRVREKEAALVVIDPLMEFIDGKVDSHKSHPVRQAIAALNQIARETAARCW